MNPNGSKEQLAATNSLIDEIKALRDSSEELLILLEHIWQNREDVRFNVSVVVTDNGREAIGESLCCYECNVDSPVSLAQALHDGWIDLSRADQEYSANYVGWCPGCQQSHDANEQCLNTSLVPPRAVKDMESAAECDAPDALARNEVMESREEMVPTTETVPFSTKPPQHGYGVSSDIGEAPQFHTRRSPAEEQRTKTPLLTRLYLHRHLEGIVRAIGYEILSPDAASERLQPLIERYGREQIDAAVIELLDVGTGNSTDSVQLKTHVRQLVRGMLGPHPVAVSTVSADERTTKTQTVVNTTNSPAFAASKSPQTRTPENVSRLGNMSAVKFTRKEMLLEFQEHLEKLGLDYELIDNTTRKQYTDKQLGTLDFILREAGEPPELVAVRRNLTANQRHDMAGWQKIIGEGGTVSVVWMYVDSAGKTSWEVANGETDERSTESIEV